MQAVVKKSMPGKIGGMAARMTVVAVLLVVILAGIASVKKKEKASLPDFVLKAKTVLVVIIPDAGEPINDPSANRTAQEEVEKAFLKWGRYRLALDKYTADLIIGVRKGTGEGCESDNQWRAGRYTSRNDRDNRQSDTDRCATRASSGSDAAGNPARASACRDGSWSGRRHLRGVSRRRIAIPFG